MFVEIIFFTQHPLSMFISRNKLTLTTQYDENYLKNLHKIDLMDFAKDQVPEAMESSSKSIQENYNLRSSKQSTSWHNAAFNPSSEPNRKNVKIVHEDFTLENAVVNNDTLTQKKTDCRQYQTSLMCNVTSSIYCFITSVHTFLNKVLE